ncbi:MAG: DnaJ domain-containing protein [Candidatus Omnitrophica bacterium]|nr:DnaJ domain-containing protein [Candidatus Omnitrophota bacterium]
MSRDQFSFPEIDRARKILGLDWEASVGEVRQQYRKFSKQFHPDTCSEESKKECEEKYKEVTWAYHTLMEYISAFRISFREKEVKQMSMDKLTYRHLQQFYDDWWGNI